MTTEPIASLASAALAFKRCAFRNGWTTFNVRDQHADEAERRLLATPPAATPAAPGYEHQRAIMEGERIASRRSFCRAHGLEETSTGWEYERGFTDGWSRALSNPAPVAAPAPVYVECRECSNCGHIGINDDAKGMAACNTCDWNGPSPKEDHCPGCERDGTMTGSCPECGHRTKLIAEARIAAPAPASEAVAWEYQNRIGKKFLTHDDPSTWHPHDREGFSEFRALEYATPSTGDSADAPVQQAALQEAARETIKWLNSYFRFHDGNKYADKLSAALKGEQPVEPSGSADDAPLETGEGDAR